jgi:PIN domain nuclease of toxin-antitoxin system
MRFLLDTHVILFAFFEPDRLSPRARLLLEDPANELHASAASAWEISTKHRLGKLPLASAVASATEEHFARLGARELRISHAHAQMAGAFPSPHRDPFDRLIAAQSLLDGITLVSRDPLFPLLGVHPIW